MKKYKNKLFSVLGDSISTLDGYSVPEYAAYYEGMRRFETGVFSIDDTWWGQVIEQVGGSLLVNNSFSGSTVCKKPKHMIESYGCSEERTSSLHKNGQIPHIIMVFMGVNDWGSKTKLLPEKEEEKTDISIFSVAYTTMLERLKGNYPNAEIMCFTLPVDKDGKNDEGCNFPCCYSGYRIEEYCEVIKNCAEKFNCKVIDLYGALSTKDTVDGFHPKAEGMKTIAHTVLSQL